MPKNILVNNSGSYQPISASFDNNGALSSSIILTINTASYVGQSGLMQIFNGQLIPVPLTSSAEYNPDGAIKVPQYSGSALSYNSAVGFGPHRLETPQFSGDISGDLTNGIKVRNLSNITGGILSSMYGGTSNTSYTINSLVTTSGSGPVYGNANKVVAVIDNQGTWGLADSSILNPPVPLLTETIVYLYTGSIATTNASAQVDQFVWSKPAGTKIIRVICQGAGGAGGGAYGNAVTNAGGRGGSGGGYADITISAENITSVTCSVGKGGLSVLGGNGGPGGSSSFGTYIYSGGGLGGASHDGNLTGVGATLESSVGYSYNGSGGTSGRVSPANVILGGAGGGGQRFAGATLSIPGGSITGIIPNITASFSASQGQNALAPGSGSYFYFNNFYLNNTSSQQLGVTFPALVWAGGTGGGGASATSVGNGSSPDFGSGGGGGGGCTLNTAQQSRGGNGGKGYILIICS